MKTILKLTAASQRKKPPKIPPTNKLKIHKRILTATTKKILQLKGLLSHKSAERAYWFSFILTPMYEYIYRNGTQTPG